MKLYVADILPNKTLQDISISVVEITPQHLLDVRGTPTITSLTRYRQGVDQTPDCKVLIIKSTHVSFAHTYHFSEHLGWEPSLTSLAETAIMVGKSNHYSDFWQYNSL